jgi:putative peptidoglycan lipid II flippase
MLSRILGLVREQVMASLFGAGFATDAFNVAFRIPNLLRDLFAEGAMSSAFVPTFTEAREKRGIADAWALGRQLMVGLAVVLVVLCAIGYVIAPWLVQLYAPGFSAVPGKTDLTVLLTRVMLPFLPAVALAAVAMGMLNASGRFGVPALAPALMNVGMVAGGLALIPVCVARGLPPILAMAIGIVVGGFAQFLVQLPPLARLGFTPRWVWPIDHPGVRRVVTLMVPATIGLAGTQFNLFVSTWIASTLQEGSVSWLWYAFRLMQLPIGVFGVALATVSMTELSRSAVTGDQAGLKTTLSATMRLVCVLTLPAALWLMAMARPVVALLYEHGRFVAIDTAQTGDALVMYGIGLPAFAAVGILTRTFYALGDTKTPLQASLVSVALNLALNLLFVGPLAGLGLGHRGLALATSLTAIVNVAQLFWLLRNRLGPLEGARMLATFVKVLIAAGIASGLCAVGVAWWGGAAPSGWIGEAIVVAAGLAVAALVGAGLMKLLRVEELGALESILGSVRRRLTGR